MDVCGGFATVNESKGCAKHDQAVSASMMYVFAIESESYAHSASQQL